MVAPATRARLGEHIELFKQTGLTGIPATIVEGQLIAGAALEGVRTAVERAARGGSRTGPRWMFGVLALLVTVVAAVSLWAARRPANAAPSPRAGA